MTAPVLREIIPGWGSEVAIERLDRDLLARAYQFSAQAHEGQFRRNGDPFVTHCVEVAKVLADLQLDTATVASGLIHDVIEDTPVTVKQIEDEFGSEISQIPQRRPDASHRMTFAIFIKLAASVLRAPYAKTISS